MMVASTKLAEYYFVLPSMEVEPIHAQLYQMEYMKKAALATALVAGVAWVAPAASLLFPQKTDKTL